MLLLELPVDVTPTLSALLNGADLLALTSVCSSARRSLLLSIRDAKITALVLPPVGQDRARTLLRSFGPKRLNRLQWIQVATPWHVDLLVECELVESVHSVRVEMIDMEDSATMAATCEKLPLLTRVTRLSVARTALVDITPLSRMVQLRDLQLSHTQVADVSCLAALTQLKALRIQFCAASDLSCVQHLTEMTVLKVTGMLNRPRFVSLSVLTKLRTLELAHAVISADDLLALTAWLDHLQLQMVTVAFAERLLENPPEHNEELTHNITHLRAVALPWISTSSCFQPTTLSRRSRFFATSFQVSSAQDMETLQSFAHVEKLSLKLYFNKGIPPEHRVREEIRDFSPLLGLVQLAQLDSKFTNNGRQDPQDYFRAAKAVGNVMRQLVQLKHVPLDAVIDPSSALADLKQLEFLELGINCASFITKFDWISRHQRLDTLKIECSLRGRDLSGIGTLAGLQCLELVGSDVECGAAATQLSFLAKLANLQMLVLHVEHLHDYAIFHGMSSLKTVVREKMSLAWRR